MEIRTPLEDGYLPPEYSKQAPPENTLENTPVVSPPIFITEVPAEAQSLALIMLDHDAIPVSGFTWIHWVTLITDPTMTELPEGISQLNPEYLVQGKNSNAGKHGQHEEHRGDGELYRPTTTRCRSRISIRADCARQRARR